MGKHKYVYNEKTLRYEKYKTSWKQRIVTSITSITLVLGTSAIIVLVAGKFFQILKKKHKPSKSIS